MGITLGACKKECTHCKTQAVIHNLGPIEVDGCGWVVAVGNTYYYPTNLDSAFKQENLVVRLNYTFTGDSTGCGDFISVFHRNIHITCIEQL